MRRGAVAAGLSVLAHAALGGGALWLLRGAAPTERRARVEEVGFAVEAVAARAEGGAAAAAKGPAVAAAVAPAVAPAPRAKRRRVVDDSGRSEQETGNRKQETGNGGETEGAGAGAGSGEEQQATGNRQQATGNGGEGEGQQATGNGGSSGPDAEAIRRLIEGSVAYPRVARRQGLEGRVVVRFRIDESGQAREVAIVESAGAILDDAAREAVLRAAPYPTTPGWVRVPVDFSLRSAR